MLGGFHFNDRKYADDDLIVGSIDPFELFRVMCEIAAARALDPRTAESATLLNFMIDQSAQRRGKDRRGDPVGDEHPDGVRESAARRYGAPLAELRRVRPTCSARTACCLDAFETDARPILNRLRESAGVSAQTRSRRFAPRGIAERLAAERGTTTAASAYESG